MTTGIPQAIVRSEVHFYIYLVTPQHCDGPCKIGFSSNPERRLQTLNCGSANWLELRAIVPCPPGIPHWGSSSPYRDLRSQANRIEKRIHQELRLFKVHGEWFDIEWQVAESLIRREASSAK